MTALTLYLPAKRSSGFIRWTVALALILAAHGALIASGMRYTPPNSPIEKTYGIILSLEPLPVQPAEQEQVSAAQLSPTEMAVANPPKIEEPSGTPEIANPAVPEPQPEPVEQIPAPAPQPVPHEEKKEQKAVGNEKYNQLVAEHLGRFNAYRPSMGNGHGTVCVKFRIDELGQLQDAYVTRSSGNKVLDQAALDLVRRANPFPAERTRSPEPFDAPIVFAPPRVQPKMVSCTGPS